MNVKVLGTKSPFCPNMNHNGPGFLITKGETKILLDCGCGTHKLLDLPEDLNNLYIFLSHLHRDHYNDVHILQYAAYSMHNLKRIDRPIVIFLPESPLEKYKNIVLEPDSYAEYRIINPHGSVGILDCTVSFCRTWHPIETYAIKVKSDEGCVVYTSDMSFFNKDKIVQFAKGANLLICESSLLDSYGFDEFNSHLTARQAAIIAKEANVGQLMLTHFWPEEDPKNYLKEAKQIFANTILAQEGQVKYIY